MMLLKTPVLAQSDQEKREEVVSAGMEALWKFGATLACSLFRIAVFLCVR